MTNEHDFIPESIKKGVERASKFVGNSTNDWGKIKYQITNTLTNEDRKKFGKRHYSTKLLILNEMDIAVMALWKELTGIEPIVPTHRLHHSDEESSNPRYHGIYRFNEERLNGSNGNS